MNDRSEGMTRRIARFIVETGASDIPASAYEHAKVAFMDWLGVTIAGKDEDLVLKLLKYSDLLGGKEQATILGHGQKRTISQAALINGAASHALDFDDTMAAFSGHPSVTLFPGLLSLSEWQSMKGIDLLTAYIIGLKTGTVIGLCAGPEHYAAGFHATSTVGHMASAAACSRLLGHNLQQTVNALGIAGTQSSGLKRSFGTMCKPFHAGLASEAGVTSALLAGDGFTSAEDILEGPNGFFQAMKGEVRESVLSTLGRTWEIDSIAQKYHASCHFTHSPIEAARTILQKENVSVRDIEAIRVHVSNPALTAADKIDANTGLEGKFSIPYCVANALLRGNTGIQAFSEEMVADPDVKALLQRVTPVGDEKIEGMLSRVEIETKEGKSYSASSDVFSEIPELELKREKIKAKFIDLCEPVLGEKKIKGLVDAITGLKETDSLEELIRHL